MACPTAGDWVEGELSIGVERSLPHFEDGKNICVTKNLTFNFNSSSLFGVNHLQPFGQQKPYDSTFAQASL